MEICDRTQCGPAEPLPTLDGMNSPSTCPCCGVVVMPHEFAYDFDGETVASLTREVAYLRATVARLRGAPGPAVRPVYESHALAG